MRLLHKNSMLSLLNNHLIDYPTPININYFWGLGSLAGFFLTIQIITGICLAMHYSVHVDLAFDSVEHILRDVPNGDILRNLHANGSSLIFIIVYLHIGRGMFYFSFAYPRRMVWVVGVIILVLMMGAAFLGYVLPWGSMSFWGTTVITKLFTAIPFIGEDMVVWLWGDFSIGNATLNRFFSLHYLLPFIIVAMSIVHISLLHVSGSSNPVSCCSRMSKISFYPYFYYKDTFGFLVIVTFWYPLTVFFNPFIFTHAANFNPADPLVTPGHIVPEWYFLCFYAILRSCPSKAGGIICMFLAIVLIALLPLLYTSPFKQRCLLYNSCFYNFSVIVYLLFKFGACPAGAPYMFYAQLCTTLYFVHFLLVLPCLSVLDRFLYANINSLNI